MIKIIDNFLNNITMYRLVLYGLTFLLLVSVILSVFNFLPYSPFSIILTILIFLIIGWSTNTIFAVFFKAPVNSESIYISVLILSLIITPIKSASQLPFFLWVTIWTIASKFIFTINKKHIFNPVAFAVVLTSFTINQSANWWVGTSILLPFVSIVGFLIVRKIKRFDLVLSFLLTSLVIVIIFGIIQNQNFNSLLQNLILNTPLFFFASIMLTEPLTTPPIRILRIIYGGLVGLLFMPQVHLGPIYFTPELALVVGNIYSYLVSPKFKLKLILKEKKQIAKDIYDFIFYSHPKFNFQPGQYMEWTECVEFPDSRGNRRYFTLSSSPTEPNIRVGIKFPERLSSFKKTMINMKPGDEIIASQLSGDFVLPENPNLKCVFIAGGIGITPFRSMIKYLIDTNQKRDIVLFYSNKTVDEIVYQDVFEEAKIKLNIKTVYALTDTSKIPFDWQGINGRIDENVIRHEVPDYYDRTYYLSGPRAMITAFEESLLRMNIPRSRIKTDYFPGFV